MVRARCVLGEVPRENGTRAILQGSEVKISDQSEARKAVTSQAGVPKIQRAQSWDSWAVTSRNSRVAGPNEPISVRESPAVTWQRTWYPSDEGPGQSLGCHSVF